MKPVIAKYIRLSDEDVDVDGIEKAESNSVVNQRLLLNDYIISSPEFTDFEVMEFLDDGNTGVNFSRPGVIKLLELAKAGRIKCIVVKDLSRWGRSYLKVGDFLEQKFPAWGVRFISLGDMYDSAKLNGSTGGIDMAFRGLIAQMYSQDLSEKVRSGKDAASKSGKIVTSLPTYGYNVDKNDRHKFVINPNEAAVIKRIYGLYEQGVIVAEIVRILNADNVTTPQMSKRAKGYKSKTGIGDIWAKGAVSQILRNEKYTGKWIYGKSRVAELGSKRAYPMPREQWIIVDGAIPAIISEEQFVRVQKLLTEPNPKGRTYSETALFARKIKCAECGRGMAYHSLKNSKVFQCVMHRQSWNFDCQIGRIDERVIYDAVLNTIQTHALLTEEEIKRQHESNKAALSYEETTHRKIRALQLSIEKVKVEKMALWEEFHNGALTGEAYKDKSGRLSDKLTSLENNIVSLVAEINEHKTSAKTESEFVKRFSRLGGISKLSKELVCELVKEIRVYASDRIEIILKYADLYET